MQTIYRRDPARNMARFYSVRLQADLLDGWSVIREWGRIGRPGRVKADAHDDLERAARGASILTARKQARGYR